MAKPFNSATDLLAFSSVSEGDSRSVTSPGFSKSQLDGALQRARDEITDRTLAKANDDFGDRLGVVTEAELYLATARLYDMWGERLGLLSTDANIVNVSEVGLGADTPPPLGPGSKMEFFAKNMAVLYRQKGLALLIGKPFSIAIGIEEEETERFPCLSAAS